MAAALQALRIAAQDIPVRHGRCSSGLVRLEVPLPRSQKALWWLRGQAEPGQTNALLQPLVYFSPRRSPAPETEGSTAASAAGVGAGSVAGAGAAWLWKGPAGRQLDGAAMADMRRFLGAAHPRVRVFGGSRFDPGKAPSPEWEEFGSYYFMLPRSV